jgi:3-hydroxypropanoate dehydrogenase
VSPSTSPLVLSAEAQDLLFRSARTFSTFVDEPVPDSTVQAIYELVKYAPTSFNQSPLRVVLVRTRASRRRLVAHMMENNKAKTSAAPLTAILAADFEFHEELPRLVPHMPEAKEVLFGSRTDREASASFNAALQVGYFIIGIRAAGLAAGPMTGYDADGIDKEFFPDGDRTVLAVVNLGIASGDPAFPRLPRLEYADVVSTI